MDKLPAVPDNVPGFVEWLRAVKHHPRWRKAALAKLRWQVKRLEAGTKPRRKTGLGVVEQMSQQQLLVLISKLEQATAEIGTHGCEPG